MDLIEELPTELQLVLTEAIYHTSEISIIVLANVNKQWYKRSQKCALKHHISRSLKCHEIAAEGSLEVLKWARFNGYDWDSRTCLVAAAYGHFELLKWARINGCSWNMWVCYWAHQNKHTARNNVIK